MRRGWTDFQMHGLPAAKSWSVVWIIGANRGDSQLRRRETLVMADGQKASVGFGAPGVSAGGEGDQFAEADFGAGFRALGKGWGDGDGLIVVFKPGDEGGAVGAW